jgi:type I restriction enzyme S subunit
MENKFDTTCIGPINSIFQKSKLIDLCHDKSGVQTGPFGSLLHKEDYVDEGTPIITVEHLGDNIIVSNSDTPNVSDADKDRLSKFQLKEGDIVFSRVGSVDRRAYISNKEEGWLFSGRCLRVRVDKEKICPKYLSYYFGFEGFKQYIRGIAVGATMPSINTKILSEVEVYYPEYQQQIVIADYLSSIDSKINLNKQTNQTLEQLVQTLFKSWFVDFEPVFDNLLAKVDFDLTKLPSDFPEALQKRAEKRLFVLNSEVGAVTKERAKVNVKASLQSDSNNDSAVNIHQHFPIEFEYNEKLGWIPKGWAASTTGDEFVVKGGSTPSTKNPDFWDGGEIHWTSPKDLSGKKTKIMLDTSRKITELGLTKITSGLLPVDTVLMSSRAPVGYLALAKVPVAINQGYIAITGAKTLSSEYTIQWLDSVMDEIKSISGGTTFAEISKKTFKSIQLVIPSKTVVDVYTNVSKAYYARITANVQEINTLTETRDYLLPKLISGEIELENITND